MKNHFLKLLPKIETIEEKKVPVNEWNIHQTISKLSYLTHNYFRYYGKFPSTVASQLLELYPAPKNAILLDNFVGSGTSLVEASLRQIPSVGGDINPLSILACEVKTAKYDVQMLKKTFFKIRNEFNEPKKSDTTNKMPDEKFLNKWFSEKVAADLARIRNPILTLEEKKERDFFALAFLAIIRRVSKAYDGEVRPHINKNKKERDVFEAFSKKVREMIRTQEEFNLLFPNRTEANSILFDSTEDYSKRLPSGNYWLVISHPPYLNCFDYLPVFNLELEWAKEFGFIWDKKTKAELRKKELRAWPAKTEKNVKKYYEQLRNAYEITYKIQSKGGLCAIVIGDCTIKGKLEKVHIKMIDIMKEVGYDLKEINYRTTHYATGKYSYEHRADYHKKEESKKDAIIVFQKP